jgi:hypothetical protein
MRFEELIDDLRCRRARLLSNGTVPMTDDDVSDRMVDQALYDARLVQLAHMLDVPVPQGGPADGGLFADHRYLLEDHLAEAGADVRAEES